MSQSLGLSAPSPGKARRASPLGASHALALLLPRSALAPAVIGFNTAYTGFSRMEPSRSALRYARFIAGGRQSLGFACGRVINLLNWYNKWAGRTDEAD